MLYLYCRDTVVKKAEGEKKEPQMVVRLSHKEKKKVAVLPSPPKKEEDLAEHAEMWLGKIRRL